MSDEPKLPDLRQAEREGWSIFECFGDATTRWQLQKCDEMDVFSDDSQAWQFVAVQAERGSKYHQGVLEWLALWAQPEFEAIQRIRRNCIAGEV